MSKDKVSIVILNFNGRKHLKAFLPSVVEHTPETMEIHVADNGSTDDSVDLLRTKFPRVIVQKLLKNYGFAEGYNQALKNIESDYYVILNSDVRVTADWIEPMINLFESNRSIAAIQPKIRSEQAPDFFEYAGAAGGLMDKYGFTFCRGRVFDELEKDHGQYDTRRQITWASGAALFIRANLFHQFGGFDGDYFAHMEEIDLCWRLRRAGYQIMVEPASVVYHLGGGTLNYQSAQKTFLNFRNLYATLLKNLPRGRASWLILFRLVIDAGAALLYLSQKRPDLIWAIARAHWAFFGNIPKIIKKRKNEKRIVEQHRIGPENTSSVYPASIVKAYYFSGQKTYNDLKHAKK